MKEWVLPTMGTFICWGLWSFIPKITTRYIDPKSAVIYEVIGGIFLSLVVLYFLNFRLETHPKGILLAVTAGLVGFVGALCFLFAVSKGPVSIIAPLSALYPILSVILAMVFLNEAVTVKQGIGILFAVVAVILVST
ncbi:MAG: EamA family transporter [Desulfobacterales bacterium]|nr:EamA family transporter [Desulfobacterales bacterium]MDX2512612.1 EamA family transporter [Desulfobacterales bacterium]